MKFICSLGLILLGIRGFSQDTLQTINLEEVVIESVRDSESIKTAYKEIKRKTINHLDIGQNASIFLEKLTPSIVSYSDAGTGIGNYHQFRLRGMDPSRINITFNGVPLNDMIDQGVYFSNFSDLSSSLESIQVQRGVGFSTNGTASYAGAISYQSVHLDQDQSQGNLKFTTGSFRTLRFNMEASTGAKKGGFSAYTRASKITSQGYKYNSGANALSTLISVGKIFDKSILKVTALAGKTENGQAYEPVPFSTSNANTPSIVQDPKTNVNPANDKDNFAQELVLVEFTKTNQKHLTWSSTAYYGGARGFFPYSTYLYHLQNDHYGSFFILKYFKKYLQINGGIHAYQFDRKNKEGIFGATYSYQDETQKREISSFVQTNYSRPHITITGGIQFRGVDMRFLSDSLFHLAGKHQFDRKDFFINPKIGMTYHVNHKHEIYISYGSTGREPTRTDLLQYQSPYASVISQGNLAAFTDKNRVKTEYVSDIELGYRYLSDQLEVNLNTFWMKFKNEISIVGGLVENSYIQLRKNVGESTRSGIEVDVNYAIVPNQLNLNLLASYLYTRVSAYDTPTKQFTDIQHAFSPTTITNFSLNWHPIRSVYFDVYLRYVSNSFTELSNNSDFILPSFWLADTQLRWEINKNIQLGIWINNLFNQQYFTNGSPTTNYISGTTSIGYNIQAPRNYFFSLKLGF